MAAIGVWIGWSVARGDPYSIDLPLILLTLSAFLVLSGGNILNDLGDVMIDQRAHPKRPLVSGKLRLKEARLAFLFIWMVPIFLTSIASVFAGTVYPVIILIISMFLISFYELFLKERGLIGNIAVGALTGLPFLFGASLMNEFSFLLIGISIMAALINISREIRKDMEDMDEDRRFRKTLPVRIGLERSAIYASAPCLLAVLISLLVAILIDLNLVYITLVVIADILFLYSMVNTNEGARGSQIALKRGMMIASLAFISLAFH